MNKTLLMNQSTNGVRERVRSEASYPQKMTKGRLRDEFDVCNHAVGTKSNAYRVRNIKASQETEGKLNASQAETVAANSTAVGQFLSISCRAIILRAR